MTGFADAQDDQIVRKRYHAPQLTTLGAIQSVVRAGNNGPGSDHTAGATNPDTGSAS